MGNCGSCDETQQDHDTVLELDMRKKEKYQSPTKILNSDNKENYNTK